MNMKEQPEAKTKSRRRLWLLAGCGILTLLVLGAVATVLALGFLQSQMSEAAEVSPTEESATPTVVASVEVTDRERQDILPGRIAFINEIGQVGTVASDGEESRLLTDEQRIFLFPAWSPSGSHLAAIGAGDGEAGVFVLEDVDDAELIELYKDHDNGPIYLYWSPDGEQVSFIAQYEQRLGLYVAPADGSNTSQLLTTGQPLYWDWTSNDRVLVHTGSTGPGSQLSFVDVNASGESGEQVADPGYFQAPAVAGRKTLFAYAAVDVAGARWLIVEDSESGETQRTPHFGVVAMGWNPTADELAFISPNFGETRSLIQFHGPLRLFDAESGDVRVLTEDTVVGFFWSPNGEMIAYLTVSQGGAERVAGEGDLQFIRSRNALQQPQKLQLTLWLADANSGETRRLLDFHPSELFVTQFLPFFDQYALSHRLWAPDSSALVLPVAEGERSRIYVVPISGKGIRAVANGSIAFWSMR